MLHVSFFHSLCSLPTRHGQQGVERGENEQERERERECISQNMEWPLCRVTSLHPTCILSLLNKRYKQTPMVTDIQKWKQVSHLEIKQQENFIS